METIFEPVRSEKTKPFKNPKRKGSRGPLSRKPTGSYYPANLPATSPPLNVLPASASPLYLPFCSNNNSFSHSQPPLLPLPRVNSSLPLPRAKSSIPLPRVNSISSSPARFSGKASDKCQPQSQRAPEAKPAPTLTRTGSVPVGSYPVDGYPGPALMLLSPPPSSLPMPRFTIKPNLSCNAEASAGDDGGAGDNLRRLLRLR
ncbi:PREDICTED: WAS/WASL-interacting protein family member 3 [Tarenaya hassleriana]|uniref:WAS/WASL-interacting protein family member 3 n=1 Tax=Tarenaya hassleriana TaxID=28532 RepID=UPI00053C7DEC|nr:PREDICTED: WAS/WASL-interacting protein family member 3 [Tarenaya hassleriana]